jgi:hypothetical protein
MPIKKLFMTGLFQIMFKYQDKGRTISDEHADQQT